MAINKKETAALTNAEMDKMTEEWGKILSEGKKVKVKIKKKNDNDNFIVPVGVNGHIYSIPKGVEVEVPEIVKKLLEEADYI